MNCRNSSGTVAVLSCTEDDCHFFLCLGCSILPKEAKHRLMTIFSHYAMEKRQMVNTGMTFVRRKPMQRTGSTRLCWETLDTASRNAIRYHLKGAWNFR
ncbi:hypothetical protein F2Q70_00000120 [Brassica cretica]|uniref:Uncharacterized protein n=1 Tax=Brassica cretica TaxID=69181 RepID=A0A8S9J1B0_BRACR|nr:hypothetical protein F2Q70_00000120 [Brassica cretica]